MKYRLGIKIGPGHRDDGQPSSEVAIGWAMMRLGQPKPVFSAGSQSLPTDEMDRLDVCDVAVIQYANPADMLEPMPIEDYQKKVAQLTAQIPARTRLVWVPFNQSAYTDWLKTERLEDTHQSRARWAESSSK
ncbi:hypothetical protein ACMYR3_06295 [Ampullimonas aquatilis]|uniref:hypothetical protein n=1 Tax=Ampullimonas aquatilis TaxID=1341549 RepID=UPI003C760CB7